MFVLAVHLVNLLGLVGPGDHSKTFLPLELFGWSTPSWSKVGVGGVVGGPSDYCVSPGQKSLVFDFLAPTGAQDVKMSCVRPSVRQAHYSKEH